MFCPHCGTPLDDDACICSACDAPVEPLEEAETPVENTQPELPAEEAPVQQDVPAQPEEEIAMPKKKSPVLKVLFTTLGIAVALAAVVALAIYLLPILAGKGPATGLYIKGNELFTTRLSKLQSWQVTEKLVNASNSELGGYDKNTYAKLLSDYTFLTKDGRLLFYPDKYTPGDKGLTIYYRNIKNPEEEPQQLDSDIFKYTVSPDGSRVVYLKSDGTLFRHNLTERTKIATGISTEYRYPHFYTSADCKNLIYMLVNEDGTITAYAQSEGGEKQKLTSNCTNVKYINDNCTTLYYTNSKNTLYKVTPGGEKQKIAYDVDQVLRVYESGEIYYTTYDPDEPPTPVTVGMFVEDDAKTNESLNALRLEVKNATIHAQYANAICYYDGQDSHKLAENCVLTVAKENDYAAIGFTTTPNSPALIYSYCDTSSVQKVKLSQCGSIDEVLNKVVEATRQAGKVFLAVKNTATQIDCEKGISAKDIRITDDSKTAYYLVKKADALMGGLYKLTIANGKPQTPELYDSDVYSFEILDNTHILYYCDYAEAKGTGDVYINQALVEYDVQQGAYHYDTQNQWLLYFINVDKEHTSGALKLWEDGENTKIADDVYTFECVDDELLYITDYNLDKGHGTLYLFQNDQSQEVDDEVSHILSSNDTFGLVFRKIYTY